MDGSLVHGELNPEYFGLTSNTLTEAMFFVDSKNPINSVSFLTPTKFKPDEANEELPHVWKVFSQKPLTDGDLNDIFKGNYFMFLLKSVQNVHSAHASLILWFIRKIDNYHKQH